MPSGICPSLLSCQGSFYARLATEERHTGRVGIVAMGAAPGVSSSRIAPGRTSSVGGRPSITLMIDATAASVIS